MHTDFQNPRWLRDLLRFIPLKSQFVLFGNVRDLQASEIAPSVVTPLPFNQSLFNSLFKAGYAYALTYTPLVGFQCLANPAQDAQETEAVMQRLGLNITEGKAAGGIDMLNHLLERLIQDKQEPIALCIDFASCLISHHDNLTPAEHSLFTRALVASHQSKARPAGEHHQPFYNTVFWIVEKETDLPDWFVINNPRIRAIPVAKPDGQVRRLLAQSLLGSLVDFNGIEEADKPQIINDFVDETEGLLLLDLTAIVQLARIEQVPAASIRDAVRRYKVGITEDPWKKLISKKFIMLQL